MKALLRLYPAAWRERYGDEVERLLEDGDADLRTRVDLVRGAIDVQRRPEVHGFPSGRLRRWLTRDHLAGLGILAGALVWAWMAAYWLTELVARLGLRPLSLPSLGQQVIGELAVAVGVALLMARRETLGRWAPLAIAVVALQGLAAAWLTLSWVTGPDGPIPMRPWLNSWTLVWASGVLMGVVAWGRAPVSKRALVLLAASSAALLGLQHLDLPQAYLPVVDLSLATVAYACWAAAWVSVGWSALRSPSRSPRQAPLEASPA